MPLNDSVISRWSSDDNDNNNNKNDVAIVVENAVRSSFPSKVVPLIF